MIFLSPQERSTPPRQGARNLSRAVPCHRSNESQRPASPSRPAPTVHPATTGTDAVYRAVRNESLASDGARALKGCAYRVGMRPATPGGWKVLLRRVGSGGGFGLPPLRRGVLRGAGFAAAAAAAAAERVVGVNLHLPPQGRRGLCEFSRRAGRGHCSGRSCQAGADVQAEQREVRNEEGKR